MVRTKWSGDRTLRFVKILITKECLWNYNSANYQNLYEKEVALQQIISEMKLTYNLDEVSARIKSILAIYRKETLRMHNSARCREEKLYVSNVKWYHVLDDAFKAAGIVNYDMIHVQKVKPAENIKLEVPVKKQTKSDEIVAKIKTEPKEYIEVEVQPDLIIGDDDDDISIKKEPLEEQKEVEFNESIVNEERRKYEIEVKIEVHNEEVPAAKKQKLIENNDAQTNVKESRITSSVAIAEKELNDSYEDELDSKKPYQCDICDKRFGEQESLTNHMSTHVNENPYQCDICKNCFSDKISLNLHMFSHTCLITLQCITCETVFTHKHTLTTHMRVHTTEIPYKCDICEKYFNQKQFLRTHCMNVHSNRHKCDTCGRCFSKKDWLFTHMLIHDTETPYICDVKKKCRNRTSCSKTHVRINIGGNRFKCNICEKFFNLKDSLIKHIHLHNEDKPYKCEHCQKFFNHRRYLIKHVNRSTCANRLRAIEMKESSNKDISV